tara:strand:- start:723 stop:1268 length:546 start_codon:yes stop_codon:yes gene_type:complete
MKYYSNPLNRFHTQIKITATTGSEIINTATAKSYLRVDTSADDTLIGQMITQARIVIENYITKDIVAKTRKLYLASVDERFVLPFSPIASIQSITVEGTATTAFTEYGLDDTIIELNSLPSKEVIVSYTTAGMNDSFLIQANLQLVSTLYDNRADFVIGQTVTDLPTSVKEILNSYKTMFI